MVVVPRDQFCLNPLQLQLFCCWGCGCCWAVTTKTQISFSLCFYIFIFFGPTDIFSHPIKTKNVDIFFSCLFLRNFPRWAWEWVGVGGVNENTVVKIDLDFQLQMIKQMIKKMFSTTSYLTALINILRSTP